MPPKQQQPERTVLHPTPSNPAPNLLANPAENPNAANPAANPNAEADPNTTTNPNTAAANPNTTNIQQSPVALVTRVLSLLDAEKGFLETRNSARFERKAFPKSDLHKNLRTTREDLNVALDELRLLAHYQPQQLHALLDDSQQMSSNHKQIVIDALSLPYRRASPFDIVNFGRAAADEFRYETEFKAMKVTTARTPPDEIQEVFLRAVKLSPETDLFPRAPFQTTQPPRKVAEVTNTFIDGSIGYVVTTAGPQQSEDVVLPKSTTTATDTKEKAEHAKPPTANTASESAVAKPPPPSRPRRPQTQRRQPSVESIVYFFSLFNKNISNQEEEGEDDEATTQQHQFQELLKRCSLTILIISRGVAAKHRRHAAAVTAVIDAEIAQRMKRQCISELERGVGGDGKEEDTMMSNRCCCEASAWSELALMLRREDAVRKIQKERRETSIQQNVEGGDSSASSFVMVHGTQHDAASCDQERLKALIALGRQQPTQQGVTTKNPRMKDDGSGDDNDNEDDTPPSAAKKNDGAAAGNNKATPANVLPNPFCKGRTNVSATALFETGQHHHAPGSAVLLEGVGGTGKTSHCEVVEYHRTIAHQRTHFIRVCSLHSGQQRRDEVYAAAMEELDATHLGEGRHRGGGGEGGVLYIVDGLDECQLVGVDPRWVLDLIHTIHQKMRKDADSLLLTTRPGAASANSELVSMFRFPFTIRHILEYDVDYVEEVMAHRPLGVQLRRSSPVLRTAFMRLLRNPLVMSQCYHFEEPADDEHGSYANSIMRHTSFQLVDALVHRWIAHDLAKVGSFLSTESVVAAAAETLWQNRDRTAAMQRHQHGDWIEQRDDLAFRRGNTACVRSFGLRPHTGTSYEEEVYYAFLLFIGATLNESPCGTIAFNYSHTARWLTQPDIEPLLRNVMRPFRPCDLRYRSGGDAEEVSLAQSAHGSNVACVEYDTRLYENPTAVGVFLHFRNGSGYHDSEAQHDCIATYASIMKHQQQQGGAVLTHVVNVRGICQINDIQHWLFHERTRSITRDDKALSVLWADEEYQPSSTGVLSALLLLRDMAKALEQLLSCGLVYREPAELSINHFAFVKPTTAEAPVVKFAAVYRLKFEDDPVCVQRQDAAAQTAAQFLRECFWPSIIREGNRRPVKPMDAFQAVDDEDRAVNLLRRAGLGKDHPKDAAEVLANGTRSIASIVKAIEALIRTAQSSGGSSSPNSPK